MEINALISNMIPKIVVLVAQNAMMVNSACLANAFNVPLPTLSSAEKPAVPKPSPVAPPNVLTSNMIPIIVAPVAINAPLVKSAVMAHVKISWEKAITAVLVAQNALLLSQTVAVANASIIKKILKTVGLVEKIVVLENHAVLVTVLTSNLILKIAELVAINAPMVNPVVAENASI